MQRLLIIHLIFLMNSDQLKDTIMISISFLVFILCRTTGSKPNLPRSDLLLEGKLNSWTKFRGVPLLHLQLMGLLCEVEGEHLDCEGGVPDEEDNAG